MLKVFATLAAVSTLGFSQNKEENKKLDMSWVNGTWVSKKADFQGLTTMANGEKILVSPAECKAKLYFRFDVEKQSLDRQLIEYSCKAPLLGGWGQNEKKITTYSISGNQIVFPEDKNYILGGYAALDGFAFTSISNFPKREVSENFQMITTNYYFTRSQNDKMYFRMHLAWAMNELHGKPNVNMQFLTRDVTLELEKEKE